MNDWMRRLNGLNRAAMTRVETTIASCGCSSWLVSVWKRAWVAVTPPKYTNALLRESSYELAAEGRDVGDDASADRSTREMSN